MIPAVINFGEKFEKISEQWSPKVIAQMNEYQFKLGRIQGEFIWHSHAETDEVFIVLGGAMRIAFRDGTVDLKEGEMIVISKGVEHKPAAQEECRIMLVEPAGTVNTGESINELTINEDQWI